MTKVMTDLGNFFIKDAYAKYLASQGRLKGDHVDKSDVQIGDVANFSRYLVNHYRGIEQFHLDRPFICATFLRRALDDSPNYYHESSRDSEDRTESYSDITKNINSVFTDDSPASRRDESGEDKSKAFREIIDFFNNVSTEAEQEASKSSLKDKLHDVGKLGKTKLAEAGKSGKEMINNHVDTAQMADQLQKMLEAANSLGKSSKDKLLDAIKTARKRMDETEPLFDDSDEEHVFDYEDSSEYNENLVYMLAYAVQKMHGEGLIDYDSIRSISRAEGNYRIYLSVLSNDDGQILVESSYSKRRGTYAGRYATARKLNGDVQFTDWMVLDEDSLDQLKDWLDPDLVSKISDLLEHIR